MKRFFALLLALTLTLSIVTSIGCSKVNENYVVSCPDGAPAIAISKLINDNNKLGTEGDVKYNVMSANDIKTQMIKGSSNIIIMPVNLATKLYKENDENDPYVLAGVITHGNFYIISTEEIKFTDLVSRQIAVPNPNAVPDWTFKATLIKNGLTKISVLDDNASLDSQSVNIKYYNQASDIVPLMVQGKEKIALIPEPAVTNLEKALSAKGKTSFRLNLQELYDGQSKAYPQAVLMIKKSILTQSLVNQLNTAIMESVEWAKNNIETAVGAISTNFENTTLDATKLTASAIEGCKIYFESAKDAKASVNNYLEQIRGINQASADLVDEDFFFSK